MIQMCAACEADAAQQIGSGSCPFDLVGLRKDWSRPIFRACLEAQLTTRHAQQARSDLQAQSKEYMVRIANSYTVMYVRETKPIMSCELPRRHHSPPYMS